MTEAYFYVDIPYHRPAAPSPFRLLQRWSGPLLLGTVLAAIAWHQDHASSPQLTSSPAQSSSSAASTGQLEDPATSSALEVNALAQQATPAEHTKSLAAHPSLVFHNCSIPHMDVKKDRNDLISGVATISSCDEAKVTLWDSSR